MSQRVKGVKKHLEIISHIREEIAELIAIDSLFEGGKGDTELTLNTILGMAVRDRLKRIKESAEFQRERGFHYNGFLPSFCKIGGAL